MGCCVQENMVIKSSSILLSQQESLENENENNFQNNFNVIPNIVVKKQKTKSNKTSEHLIQKGKSKTRKSIKSMNALKELSYNEVCECTKYF